MEKIINFVTFKDTTIIKREIDGKIIWKILVLFLKIF